MLSDYGDLGEKGLAPGLGAVSDMNDPNKNERNGPPAERLTS
jgi:hypothetical protein